MAFGFSAVFLSMFGASVPLLLMNPGPHPPLQSTYYIVRLEQRVTCKGRPRDSHCCSQVGFRCVCTYGRVAKARAALMIYERGVARPPPWRFRHTNGAISHCASAELGDGNYSRAPTTTTDNNDSFSLQSSRPPMAYEVLLTHRTGPWLDEACIELPVCRCLYASCVGHNCSYSLTLDRVHVEKYGKIGTH